MPDQKTIAVYNEKAADYIRLTATSAPDPDLQGFIDALPQNASVLDIGCGPATASAHLRAAGHRPDPVDPSEGMVALANETYNIGARLGTFDDITESEVYDGIWANFSLLHAPREDLPKYIQSFAQALTPNGIFHIGMKTGSGMKRDDIDRLYTYVTVPELYTLLTDAGLTITYTREGEDTGLSGSIDPFVICRAVKHG